MWRGRRRRDPLCLCCFTARSGWLRRAQSAEVPDVCEFRAQSPKVVAVNAANEVELDALDLEALEGSVMETVWLQMARDCSSVPSIVRPTTHIVSRLSETQLRMSLARIDSDGDIIGKRGIKKLRKKKAEQFEVAARVGTVEEAREQRAQSQWLEKRGDGGMSITVVSGKRRVNSKSVRSTTVSETDAHAAVTTLVFELSAVLLTQSAKVERKTPMFVAGATDAALAMLFGGEDRLRTLTEWLAASARARAGARACFVVTDEDSKMAVLLLQRVGLLRHFVSADAANPKKLLSHVIGYNHKMARSTRGKRHLVLMKLMQFVGCRHQEMMYVGGDEQVVRHMRQIQVCRTHHVKTQGMTAADLKQINAMCF